MILISCFLGGGAAGVAGMVEIAAIHGKANASLVAGYGYTGIFGGVFGPAQSAGGHPCRALARRYRGQNGLLQRVDNLPDATVNVLQGILFVLILASESLYGRYNIFRAVPAPALARRSRRPSAQSDGHLMEAELARGSIGFGVSRSRFWLARCALVPRSCS